MGKRKPVSYLVFVFLTAVSSCGGRDAVAVAATLHQDLTAVAGTELNADPVMKHTLTVNLQRCIRLMAQSQYLL
jgi:hypothetical protein